jgi:hypothetical protein
MRTLMIAGGAAVVVLGATLGASVLLVKPASADRPLGPSLVVTPTGSAEPGAGGAGSPIDPTDMPSSPLVRASDPTTGRPSPSGTDDHGGGSGGSAGGNGGSSSSRGVETVAPLPAQSVDDHGGQKGKGKGSSGGGSGGSGSGSGGSDD